MDEISFRLSNQIETLQIYTSIVAQQGHQWYIAWLERMHQLIDQICQGQPMQYVKNITLDVTNSAQKVWQDVQFQYYNGQWNNLEFYRQLGQLYNDKVSKKEIAFCVTGIAIGAVIGYYIGIRSISNSEYPHYMKTIACHHYYGIEGALIMEDVKIPTIKKSNELLIQVKAASLSITDAKICFGYSKMYRKLLNSGQQKELPVTLGRDCAGIIVDIGRGVVNFEIGDEVVLAVPSWASGTMAQYIVVSETQVARRPKTYSFEISASLPYNGCLAWDALVNRSVIKEGNARGKRVLIYGASTPIGCILIQLIKLWDGYVVAACRSNAMRVMQALGADDIIVIGESDIDKQLQLREKFDAIFFTDNQPFQEQILKKYLLSHGSYVSTAPEQLISDSFGFICETIFAGYVNIKLLVQYVFGFSMHQWKEGSKLNVAYLRTLCELTDANQLQLVVDKVYTPHNIEWALLHILNPDSIGSTIITFNDI